MAKRIVKYNPAFLSKEELVRSFVVRHAELELIVQVVRENTGESNQHVLVIGPRGIGKTMLVLRVVEEIRGDEDLGGKWYPLVFGEESYQVSTPGEFWLEALFHLAHKTEDERWRRTYEELRDELDEERLRERALAQLMDFADSEGKRILLVVENFNMLLGEQISDSDAWKLRHTLLHEPRVMLVATATSRFEEVENAEKAMFELFKLHDLQPLDERECGRLWASISHKEVSDKRVRPIHILTGGSPRLLAIISTFAAKMSLKELMDDLMQLVDDHTEYFKSHLDGLPAIERKVYLALAELWDPATAREVADFARLNVNKASSLLRRLMERGMVVEADGDRRAKLYEVAERMYNIYYLMRRRGAPSQRVKGLVRFMVPFYGEEEVVSLTRRVAEEACKLAPEVRGEHFLAYEALVESAPDVSLRERLIRIAPAEFFRMADIPSTIRGLFEEEKRKETERVEGEVVGLLGQATEAEEAGRFEEAVRFYRRATEIDPGHAAAWASFGWLLHEKFQRYDEAEEAYREAVKLRPEVALGWALLGSLLHQEVGRYEEAEGVYRKAVELDPDNVRLWVMLGVLLHVHLGRYDEAEKAYREALAIDAFSAEAWGCLGRLLHEKLGRYGEAEKAYRKAIEMNEKYAWAWGQLGWLLHEKLERFEEAEVAYRRAIDLAPDWSFGWGRLAELLHYRLGRYEEAAEAYRKGLDLEPDLGRGWFELGQLLGEKLERYEEAEVACRKVTELLPEIAPGWGKLGELLHYHLGRYEDAEEAYRKAIDIDKKYVRAWAQLGLLLHEKLGRYEEAEMAYRQALAIDAFSAVVWGNFGRLLHEKLGRYKEAEAAYRKAVEIDDKYAWAWGLLGWLLHEKLERFEEAEKAYRKVLEINDKLAWGWALLGRLLHEKLERYEEAKKVYSKAIELDPKDTVARCGLLGVLLEKLGEKEAALAFAEDSSAELPEDPIVLNNCAWVLYKHGGQDLVPKAEALARAAVEIAPDEANVHGTLASILLMVGKMEEALEHGRKYLDDADTVERTMDDVIELFVGLAAAGYGREALEVLRESPSAEVLEPLVVGLRMYVGEDVKAAAEIMEVGKDVVKRIEQQRKEMRKKKEAVSKKKKQRK